MAEKQRVIVDFTSETFDSIADNLFHVIGFEGTEAISQPFQFTVDLISAEPDINLEELVGKEATLSITRDDATRKIHGVILTMEQSEETQFDHYQYHAVLVPRLSLMNLSRQNQIYQEKTVPDIVTEELLEGDFCGGLVADDLDFRVTRNYPVREYVVQYKETDLNFVSRLLEHEGIYYYFDHQDERDRIIFCDEKSQLDAIIPDNRVSYVPASGLASFDDEAIHSFRLKQTQVSSEIILKDFNYRQPHLPLQGNSDVGDLGYGRLYDYGDHFKNPEEGDKLAQIRAQAELCKQKVCVGKSDAILFEAGKLMEMLDHYRDDLNHEYLITRIHHRGGQSIPGVSAQSKNGEAIAYMNDFEAIPASIEYRPALIAPKPKLYGIMSATVDGEVNSDRAQIDEHGRYKLVMPFDISGNGEGKACRWVRKAEMYGGQGTGMHFPLLKGSEVIWTCIDGDPDRPIITGVVPNPLNKSVVTAQNSTRNVLKTPGGMTMIMDDGQSTSSSGSSSQSEQQQTRIDYNSVKCSSVSNQPNNTLILQQQSVLDTSDKEGVDEGTSTDAQGNVTQNANADGLAAGEKMYSMAVTDYNSDNHNSYFRMGAPDTSQPLETDYSYADASGGIFMSTDGKFTQSTSDDFFSKTSGVSFTQNLSSSASYTRGYNAAVKLTGSTNIYATYDLSMGLGATAKLSRGYDIAINYGLKFTSGSTKEYKNVSGPLIQQAKDVLIRASTYDGATKTTDKILGGATIVAGLGAAATTALSVPTELGTWNNSDTNKAFLDASLATSASTVAGAILYAKRKIKHEADELKKSAGEESFIAMDNDSIVLSCDGSSIVINGEGIFINGKTLATGQLPGGDKVEEFSPNKDALKDAKVAKIFPQFININATDRVDVRSKKEIYITSDKSLKMKDKGKPTNSLTENITIAGPPKEGAQVVLGTFNKGQLNLNSTNILQKSKKKMSIKAAGTFNVETAEAKFDKKVTVGGVIKDKNIISS